MNDGVAALGRRAEREMGELLEKELDYGDRLELALEQKCALV